MIKEHNVKHLVETDEVGQKIEQCSNTFSPGTNVTLKNDNSWRGIIIASCEDQATVLWTQEGEFFPVGQFTLPLVRRVFSQLVAQDITSVQPMTLPSGLIYFAGRQFPSGSNQ